MKKSSRMTFTKEAAVTVISTLSYSDWVGVIDFDS